jgi:hypothetical protein
MAISRENISRISVGYADTFSPAWHAIHSLTQGAPSRLFFLSVTVLTVSYDTTFVFGESSVAFQFREADRFYYHSQLPAW